MVRTIISSSRIFALCLACIALFNISSAQIFTPVKWKFSVKALENNEYEISASASIEDTWHVYALNVSDKADAIGPIPTTIKINPGSGFELVGKTKE